MAPRVSIIITTRNRAQHLRGTLASFQQLHIPRELPTELLVVDNASTDDTAEVIKSTRLSQLPVRYLFEPKPGQSNARNSGMANTKGEVILFTDDDVRVPVDWIARMCDPILFESRTIVAGGVCLVSELLRPWMQKLHRCWLAATERLHPSNPTDIVGANMAFSRLCLKTVPGFDPELGPGASGFGDDTNFVARLRAAGHTICGRLDVVVEHWPDVSRLRRQSWLESATARGRSKAYIAHHWSHLEIRNQYVIFFRSWLRLCYWRWRYPAVADGEEGCELEEMLRVQRAMFHRYYLKESRVPRKYERHGLQKRHT